MPRTGYTVKQIECPGKTVYTVCKSDDVVFMPEDDQWHPCGEQWECALVGGLDAQSLQRLDRTLSIVQQSNSAGQSFLVPQVLRPYPNPGHQLDTPIGPDWQPSLHEWQETLINCAEWVRSQMIDGITTGLQDGIEVDAPGFDVDPVLAAKACAAALTSAMHIEAEALLNLRLMDITLIQNVLLTIAGINEETLIAIVGDLVAADLAED